MMCLWQVGALLPPTTSYANAGGQGDRTASVTTTNNFTWADGVNANLVNGSKATNNSNSVDFPGSGSTPIADGSYIRFDFAVKKYIDEVSLFCDSGGSGAPNNGAWKVQASNDASSWTDVGSFTWNQTTQVITLSGVDAAGYRYYQMIENDTGKNWTGNWFEEAEFKIAPGAT